MKNLKLVMFFVILTFFVSCKSDKKFVFFAEYLNNNYSINAENKDLNFLIYQEYGCPSCNDLLANYLTIMPQFKDMYIIYISSYPDPELLNMLRNKYGEKLLTDRSDYLNKMDLGLKGSGRIMVRNNEIKDIESFDPVHITPMAFIEYMVKN